jgi:hypothetical protein
LTTENRNTSRATDTASTDPTGNGRRAGHRSRGRALTLVVILISFTLTSILQHVTQATHYELVRNTASQAKVSNLNSFSLALLLGGLRGPLVMLLWTSSEQQKQAKELEDFDSKVELIRLLQPEFDSVHIFQMWNKAYNISVQMANKANKYVTILDAIQYGYNINQSHQDDVNIISQIGQLFFDKLGNSSEKEYYTQRVRRESFLDEHVTLPTSKADQLDALLVKAGVDAARREVMVAQAKKDGAFTINKLSADELKNYLSGDGVTYAAATPTVFNATGRRIRLDPVLDLDGQFLADVVKPKNQRPADLPSNAEWDDGAEYGYIQHYAPFPYGVPPMAIGYNYYKRCQVLKDLTHQKHLQLSDLVVDNRPAINLKLWGETEWGAGRKLEIKALGQEPFEDRVRNELVTAAVPPTASVKDVDAVKEAIYHYKLTARIADDAEGEYARHIRRFPSAEAGFKPHRQSLVAMKQTCLGDVAYLEAMLAPATDAAKRDALLAQAVKAYKESLYLWEEVMLEHYLSDEMFMGMASSLGLKGVNKDNVDREDKVSRDVVHKWATGVAIYFAQHPGEDLVNQDRQEMEYYVRRSFTRLVNLHAEPKLEGVPPIPPPAGPPLK